MSGSDSSLKNRFLDGENRLEWADLGGALAGVGAYQFLRGIAGIPLGIGRAISEFLGSIEDAVESGGDTLTSTLVSQADAAFGTTDFGLFSFPVALVLILTSVAIVVIGYRRVVFNE